MKNFILFIAITGLFIAPIQGSAVELPPGLTPLHHWDAYDPNGNGVQPPNGSVLSNLVDLAGSNDAGPILNVNAPTYLTGDSTTIGGQPTLRFTTADGLRAINSITDQSVTIFSVTKMNGGQNRRLITGANPSNYLLGYHNNSEDRAYNGAFFGTQQPVTTNPHMYIHQALNDGTDILHDADELISNTDGIGGTTPIGPLGFGGINWSAGEASDGDISEIIIFDSDMDPSSFVAVGLYLSEKYGFAAFGHDGTALGGGPAAPSAFTWTNTGGDNLWTNPANWFGNVVPGSNDVALIATNALPGVIDLTGAQPVGAISFRPGASGFTLSNGTLSAGSITHQSAGTNYIASAISNIDEIQVATGLLSLDGGLSLDRPLTINVVQGTLGVNSAMTGSAPIDKIGNSVLSLQAANAFTGGINLLEGTIHVAADGALGDPISSTVVGPDAVLALADGLNYTTATTIELLGTLRSDGNATLGASAAVTLLGCPHLHADAGQQLTVLADLDFICLNTTGAGMVDLGGALGSIPDNNRIANFEGLPSGPIPLSSGGTNFTGYIDNDGVHSWLLVGRGRDGWEFDADGQGTLTDVISNLGTTNAFTPAAYSEDLINGLLDQSGLAMTDVEIRIRRTLDPAGTSYQEARWELTSLVDWSWQFDNAFPVKHRIISGTDSPFQNANSNTRDTPNVVNGTERIFTWAWGGHAGRQGFSFGSAVTNGTNNLTSFLWETLDENHAIPYTEVYIRSLKSEGLFKKDEGTLVLRGTNTYTSLTTVEAGTLDVRSATALGDVATDTLVEPGATLSFGGNVAQTTLENIVVSQAGPGGIIGNSDGNNQFDGTISITGSLQMAVNTFTGGDEGEGLDLDGDFLYAINVFGPGGLQVRDALFTDETSQTNVVVTALNSVLNWQDPEFGQTFNDNNLEVVMQSIRWHPFPRSMTVDIGGLTPGDRYKLQLLFYEPSLNNRGWDMYLDALELDNQIADNFTAANGGPGTVATLIFTASQTSHQIIMNGGDALAFGDRNPILQGITVEQNIAATENFSGHARLESSAGTLTLAGPVYMGSSRVELGGNSDLLIPSDLVGGINGLLYKTDNNTVTLSGNNDNLLGNITIDSGTLLAASDNALGMDSSTEVKLGGTLALSGDITIENESLFLNGAQALENVSGSNTIAFTSQVIGDVTDVGLVSSAGTLVIDCSIDLQYAQLLVDGSGDTRIDGNISTTVAPGGEDFETVLLNGNPITYYSFDNILSTNSFLNDGSLPNSLELLGAATAQPGLRGNGLAIPEDSNGLAEVNLPGTLTPDPIPLPADGNYTVGGWFNGLHDTSSFRTFTRSNSGGDHQVIVNSGDQRLGMWQGGFQYSGYNVDGTAGPPIDARTGWRFLVAVGHDNDTTDYYIDGTYVGTAPRTSRTDIWRIGAWPGQTFADIIDDFFVFDRSLEATEIELLWRANTGLVTSNHLTKAGSGTLYLSNDNDYANGTTINGGTLLAVNASGSATGPGNVSVNAGGVLGGDGRLAGSVNIAAGGILAPGESIGDLTIAGSVQFTDVNSVLAIELNGPNLTPLEYDRVLSGGLNLNGILALVRDPGYAPNNTQTLRIATSPTPITGSFAGLSEGATVLDNLGEEYIISYQGNAITLTPTAPFVSDFGVSGIGYAAGPGGNQASVLISWQSLSGVSYMIESAPHPEGPWTPIATGIPGQAGVTMHTAIVENINTTTRLYLRVGSE